MDGTDVLIIDDDQAWAGSVAQLLDDAGFVVRSASDGEQALELLATEQPALVILDVHLPCIGGMDVLREFRQRNRHTPVLMMSADDRASIQDRAMSEGATAFLRKPTSVPLLLRAVRRYLADRNASVDAP
jgi:two-component system alkaline phosphatase synthesis response regulator PhoP